MENSELPKEIGLENDNTNQLLEIIDNIQKKINETNQDKSSNSVNTSVNNSAKNNMDYSKILEYMANENTNQTKTSQSANSFENLDMNMILRLSKIFSSINKDDPRKNLLLSLKPFLGNSRQKNVDTYVFLLGILNALDSFTSGDSGLNGNF